MRTRVVAGITAVIAVVLGLAVVQAPPPAAALSPGVAFSADDEATWQTNGVVYALGTAHGKVIAGGTFSQVRPPTGGSGTAQTRNALVILNAETGAPDSCQFAMTLSGGTPTVRAVEASTDGSVVYIAGNFSSVGGVTVARIAALDVVSCTVKPFRAPLPSSTVTALDLSGNVLYAGGLFNSVGTQTRRSFAAFNATSGALLDWTADAVRTRTDLPPQVGQGRAVQASPDGSKVVVGGDLFEINGVYSHSLAIVSGASGSNGAGGTVLKTYAPGFIPDTSITKTIIDGGDGRFYIGNEGTGGGVFDGRAAFSWDTGDQVWRDTCLGATQSLVMYQSTLYSASHSHDCSGINAYPDGIRRYFLAQNPDTTAILGWLPLGNDGTGEGIGPRALVVATGATTGKKYLWSGGEFTRINGRDQQGLTRFGPDDIGVPPTPVVTAQATSDGSIQVRFRTVVDPDDSDLTYSVYRNGSATPLWTGVSKSLWWERPQVTFVDKTAAPGTTYSYRVTASDGTNTSALSSAASATGRAAAADYSAAVRADKPVSLWSGVATGSWLQDSAAADTTVTGVPATLMDGATTAGTSAVPGTTGSMQFDGVDDYSITDQLRAGPSTYSVEAWINTTSTSGGKIVGFGNGRPRTGTNVSNLSGNYDRHIYMANDGRVSFGVYTGGTVTVTSPQSLNDGQWHHIVGTQGPEGMRLYVDGLRVGLNSVSAAQGYYGVWRVGGDQLNGWPNQPSSNFFAGQIDEVAIYGAALKPAAVANHYVLGGGDLDVNDAPADEYGASVFGSEPSLYWRFDDTSDVAADSSYFGASVGGYNTGAVKGQPGVVAGSDSVTLPGDESGTVGMPQNTSPTSSMTGEIWFNTTTTAGGKIFGFENTQTGNGQNYDKHLYMTNEGHLVWGTWIGYSAVIESPLAYNDGKWHQAVGVLDESGRKLYVDGQLVASSNVTGAENGEGKWRVGGGNIGGWPGQPSSFYFGGALDEFAIYPTALDATTIGAHYALGIDDDTAPSVPTALSGTAQADGVHLGWTASTDSNGVASYSIYRGTTSDFVVGESNLVGTSTTPSFVDTLSQVGTRYYKVVAVDSAGNVSAASSAAEIVVPDMSAPTAPATVSAELSGVDEITVTWSASTDNVGVTRYDVHRGTTTDFTPSLATKVGDTSSRTFAEAGLTPGDYFYKVIAADAAGNASAASPTATATVPVPDTSAPSAPTEVDAVVAGDEVTLTWTGSTDNVGVTGYVVYRGDSAGFTPNVGSKIADVTSTTYTDENQPSGTQYYKVIAVDAAGNASSPSAAVSATVVAPDTSAPTAPSGLSGALAGDDVTLTWTASDDNVGVAGYVVYRGSSAGFTADAGSKIADATTTSYVDSNRPAGVHYYKVIAVDAAGNTSAAASTSVTIAGAETVTVTVSVLDDAMVLQSVPTTNYGTNTQLSARGGSSAIQSFVSLELPAAPAGTTLTGATLRVRTSTDPTATTTDVNTVELVSGAWTEAGITWNNRPTNVVAGLGSLPAMSALNTAYSTQLSTGALSSRLGTTQTLRLSGPGADNLRLWSSEAANASYRPVLVLEFTPLSGPDTVAPSAPGNVNAAASGSGAVEVTWAASTDNVGVARYEVFRGTSSGFTANAASRVSQGSALSYTDPSLAPGTYFYKVVAVDAAGNASPTSAAASATVSAPDSSAPGVPGTPAANVSGSTVQLSWTAASDNVGVTGYSVYRGSSEAFAVNDGSKIADVTGTTRNDGPLAAGTYYYKVVARDAAGNVGSPSNAGSATVVAEPQTTTVSVNATADAAVYSTAPTTNYGSSNQLASRGGQQESFIRYTLPTLPSGATLTGVSLVVRTSTDPTATSAASHDLALVTGAWEEASITWNNRPTNAASTPLGSLASAPATNTAYTVPLSVSQLAGGQTITIRVSSAGADNLRIFSKEATSAATRPVLSVTYVTP